MAPSSPQLASLLPSGLTLSDCIVPWCAWRTCTHSPLCTSNQRSLPSLPPLTSSCPLGAQVTAETPPGCPTKALLPAPQAGWRSPRGTSHTKSSPPSLPLPPEASHVPLGLQATLVTTP